MMDSAIRLSYATLPAPPRFSSGAMLAATPAATRLHLSISHGSLSLSHCTKYHPSSRPLRVINCKMLDRFSESEGSKNDEEDDNKIVRGMAGVSLALACVLGAFSVSSKMNPKSHVAYACWPWSSAHAETQNESPNLEVVLDSFLQMNQKGVPSVPPSTHPKFQEAPSQDEIKALKLYAMSVSNIGDPSGAVRILESEYNRWKEKAEAEHLLEMALIELLLIQRKYHEASKLIENQISHRIQTVADFAAVPESDKPNDDPSRLSWCEICLYKVIVNMMLGENDQTKQHWKEELRAACSETLSLPSPPPPPPLPQLHNQR